MEIILELVSTVDCVDCGREVEGFLLIDKDHLLINCNNCYNKVSIIKINKNKEDPKIVKMKL